MMEKLSAWAGTVWAKTKVVLGAWPTWAAGITAVVTGLTIQVVPELPGPWGVKVLAGLAALGTVVRVVSHVVAIVTPVLFPENRGLLAPPPAQMPGPAAAAPSRVRTLQRWDDPLPPVPPEAYPPGSERLPHRRI